MLIKVPKSLTTPDTTSGLVQLVGLAGVRFHIGFSSRVASDVLATLVDESEEDRVVLWLDARPDTTAIFLGEVDSAEWLTLGRLPPPRPAPLVPLTATLALAKAPARSLDEMKRAKATSVDAKTDMLISAGFVVGGKRFSASDNAQLKWLGMFASKEILTYPLIVPTKDDTEAVELVDAQTLEAYYGALLLHVQGALASGVAIKQQIAAAASEAALDAIVDNRT